MKNKNISLQKFKYYRNIFLPVVRKKTQNEKSNKGKLK